MKLSQIKIENFKSLRSFELEEPKRLNVVVGNNGAGKTSLMEAIRYILTGKTPNAPITSGEDHCVAAANFLGAEIVRTYGKKNGVKLNGKTTTQKSIEQLIYDTVGCTIDTVELATSANMLSAMSAGEFSEYLISNNLIPAEIDLDMLYKLCTVSPEARVELSKQLPGAPIKFNMGDIERAYDYFYAERKATKVSISKKEQEALYTGIVPTRTVEQVDKDLQHFHMFDCEMEAYKKLKEQFDDALKKKDEILSRIKTVEEHIRVAGTAPSVNPQELEFLNKQYEANVEAANQLEKTIHTWQSNIEMISRTLSNLDKPVCPISEKLICTTDKTGLREELTELLSTNQSECRKVEEKHRALLDDIASVKDKIRNYRDREQKYSEVQKLHDRRKTLMETLPEIPSEPVPPAVPSGDMTEKKALIEERERILRYLSAEKAKDELTGMKKHLDVLEELLKLLSPKSGIRQEIIRVALEPIVLHCNERASKLKMNFEIGLVADNGVKIVCCPNTSSTSELLPLENASSGEQAYVLFLMMDALNALHGLGLLLFDDLDKLDCAAFEALLNLLSKPGVLDSYDHVFMAMVDHKDALETIKKFEGTVIDNVITL